MKPADFYLVATPIGNLEDITLRALKILKEVDLIYCEDTRRTLKLLSHFEIKKSLRSCPYFRERKTTKELLDNLAEGKKIAFVSDAGMPGISDPGEILLAAAREAGYRTEVIGGVSSITQFVAGLGRELEDFHFVGFLPEKSVRRSRLLEDTANRNLLFFESTHRIKSTLEIMNQLMPDRELSLGKELTKISEAFFHGKPMDLLKEIPSWKGEWLGLWWEMK